MTIRTRILLAFAAVIAVTLAMAAILFWDVRRTRDYIRHNEWSQKRYAAYAELEAAANGWLKEVSDVLMLGDQQKGELLAAKERFQRSLARLTRLVEEELVRVGPEEGLREKERLGRLRALYDGGAEESEAILALAAGGNRAEAGRRFGEALETMFDKEFASLVAQAMVEGRRAEETGSRQMGSVAARTSWLALGLSAFSAVFIATLGLLLTRDITRPIKRLTAGTAAIGRGDFGHRIGLPGNDELAQLARHFDEMAAQLGAQGEQLLTAQAELERKNEALGREIAERQQAETALRGSSAKLSALAEEQSVLLSHSRDFVYRHDTRGVFTYLSPAVESITGHSVQEWLTHYSAHMTDNPINEKVYEYTERALRTGKEGPPYQIEICHKDGSPVMLEVNERPYFEGGKVAGIVGVARDVTVRWRAQEALRRSELLNRSLVEHLPQRIFIKDRNSVYMSCNANYARDLEIEPEQIVGKDDFAFYPRELADMYRADDKAVMDSGIPKDIEEKYVVAGEERWVHTVKVPFRDEHRRVIGVLGIFEDITERKQAAQQLQRYAERLEALNAELARSNRDLEEFTYTVSHDLQEPLRKIHTFGQFLAEDCGENLPELAREHLRRIQAASVRMNALIQHLLSLARVGTQGKQLVPTHLRPVVEEAVDVLSEKARDCEASIVLRDGLPRVMGDPVQLGQVFQNLIGNALKFRAPGRAPSVVISAQVQGATATVAVADNGIGIEERHFDRIFGIFQRLHRQEEYEGEGVGLALCAKIIRRHGGRIWVESEVGKGSTFFFTLKTVAEGEGKDDGGRPKPADAAGSPG